MAELGGVPRTTGAPGGEVKAEHLGRYEHRRPDSTRTREVIRAGSGLAIRREDGMLGPVRAPFAPDVFGDMEVGFTAFIRNASGDVVGLTQNSRHSAKVA